MICGGGGNEHFLCEFVVGNAQVEPAGTERAYERLSGMKGSSACGGCLFVYIITIVEELHEFKDVELR